MLNDSNLDAINEVYKNASVALLSISNVVPEITDVELKKSDKSTSDMYKASTYTSFGFDSTYWYLIDGDYMSLKGVDFPF